MPPWAIATSVSICISSFAGGLRFVRTQSFCSASNAATACSNGAEPCPTVQASRLDRNWMRFRLLAIRCRDLTSLAARVRSESTVCKKGLTRP